MTRKERVRYEALLRIRDFVAARQDRFPESSSGRVAFATVASAVAQIEEHTAAKLVAVRESHRDRIARRQLILDRMASIARTSRGVTLPSGATLRLRMPTRKSDVATITSARAFLWEAEPHQDQLVKLGLPATYLTELRDATEAFDEALKEGRAGRSGVAAAQAGITAALADGLAAQPGWLVPGSQSNWPPPADFGPTRYASVRNRAESSFERRCSVGRRSRRPDRSRRDVRSTKTCAHGGAGSSGSSRRSATTSTQLTFGISLNADVSQAAPNARAPSTRADRDDG